MSDVSKNECIGNNDSKDGEDRRLYLQMLQGNIERMSTLSAAVKGLVIAVVAGILQLLAYTNFVSFWHFLSFLSACLFMILFLAYFSRYYLFLEKCYRTTYKAVLAGKKTDNFDMNPFASIPESESTYVKLTKRVGIGTQFFIFVIACVTIFIVISYGFQGRNNNADQEKPTSCLTTLEHSIHLDEELVVR